MENLFKIGRPDFVSAIIAGIFRGTAGNIHLVAAGTKDNAAEQIDRSFGWLYLALMYFVKNLVALCPEFLGNDRLYRHIYPALFRLVYPMLVGTEALGIVCARRMPLAEGSCKSLRTVISENLRPLRVLY
ncbi:MAG: hypothetical protein PHX89_06840, partial [bacterium]|nr:hypothetical protein [bacterium]